MRMGRLGKLFWAEAGAAAQAANTPIKMLNHRPLIARHLPVVVCPGFTDRMPTMAAASKQDQVAFIGALRRPGIVIAATPATTQARPIHAVGARRSPRNTTLTATPIGTRR